MASFFRTKQSKKNKEFVISESEWARFVDKGEVNRNRIRDLVYKYKTQKPLDEKETAMFIDKIKIINKKLML